MSSSRDFVPCREVQAMNGTLSLNSVFGCFHSSFFSYLIVSPCPLPDGILLPAIRSFFPHAHVSSESVSATNADSTGEQIVLPSIER
jgi:hypothetical protein